MAKCLGRRLLGLIRAAFNAHRRQEYELAIPVILAQTGGICKEVVNEYLFIKNNKKPGTAIYAPALGGSSAVTCWPPA